jgi:hypothetical protein
MTLIAAFFVLVLVAPWIDRLARLAQRQYRKS